MNQNSVLILLEYPELCLTNWLIRYLRAWIILIYDHITNEGNLRAVGCFQENAATSPEKAEGEGSSVSSETNSGEKWWGETGRNTGKIGSALH